MTKMSTIGHIEWKLHEFGKKGGRIIIIKKPALYEEWTQVSANDSHIYDDDLTMKTTQVNEIYQKLESFGKSSKKSRYRKIGEE